MRHSETYKVQTVIDEPFTEIQVDDLYFCQEQRLVCISEQVIELTAKEFDILALLITHPKRVFTYELIMELVWNEDYSYYSRKAVNNHVSKFAEEAESYAGFPRTTSKALLALVINLKCRNLNYEIRRQLNVSKVWLPCLSVSLNVGNRQERK